MNIYILDSDQQKIPDLLADDDLSAMIEDIANALLSAHVIKSNKGNGLISNNTLFDFVFGSSASGEWVNWITECAENYDYLVSLGLDCCREFYFRFNSEHKKRAEIHTITIHPLQSAIEWCSGNRPDLSVEISLTKFPLVMPGEFKLVRLNFAPAKYAITTAANAISRNAVMNMMCSKIIETTTPTR